MSMEYGQRYADLAGSTIEVGRRLPLSPLREEMAATINGRNIRLILPTQRVYDPEQWVIRTEFEALMADHLRAYGMLTWSLYEPISLRDQHGRTDAIITSPFTDDSLPFIFKRHTTESILKGTSYKAVNQEDLQNHLVNIAKDIGTLLFLGIRIPTDTEAIHFCRPSNDHRLRLFVYDFEHIWHEPYEEKNINEEAYKIARSLLGQFLYHTNDEDWKFNKLLFQRLQRFIQFEYESDLEISPIPSTIARNALSEYERLMQNFLQ